jgi:hypothetical protein
MFEIETAIQEWRRQMSADGIRNSAVLQELEEHLRDDVEFQTDQGLDAAQAFERVKARLGPAKDLRREFGKLQASLQIQTMKTKLIILLAVIAVLAVELAFVLPAVAQAKMAGPISPVTVILALTGAVAINAVVAFGARAWYRRSQAG